ncbi:Rv3654c family TadE-like protein [Streptomyces sp. BK239]|uniref:Rv3654c family TadE-like protein n=1 Tax=Streptomyces sp. BK239 TaxID=2512155 RepID=UPI00387E34C7
MGEGGVRTGCGAAGGGARGEVRDRFGAGSGRGGGAVRCRRVRVGRGPGVGRHGHRRSEGDRGSATLWSLGAITVLCVVFGVVLALGQAVVVRHRAAGGADLAALAAADHWMDGAAAACARAERVARAQGARLVRCAIVGEVSDVTAASGRGPFTAEVRARAGPPSTQTVVPEPLPRDSEAP